MLAILLVATALTIRLEPLIQFSGFVFFYGAVVAAALYAGVPGGLIATVVGILVVIYEVVPPPGTFEVHRPADFLAILAFASVSIVVTALAESMRQSRRTAEERAAKLESQTGELEMRRREAEALAAELEDSNLELETTIADAKRARDTALASEERLRLVDQASRVLTSSLDYETTVAALAKLAVPDFADWCRVDMLVDGEVKRLAVAHVDPEKTRWAHEVGDVGFARQPDARSGVSAVIRTGKPLLLPVVTDEMLAEAATDAENLAMLRSVGVHSVIIVPIRSRGRTLGALTLIGSRPDRIFDEADLTIAEDLARRAAVAIDRAQLYRSALAANDAKSNFLATMSHELRTPLTAIIGYEELLSDGITGPIQENQRQQLNRIKVSAMHLLSMIDQILLYTRTEVGRETATFKQIKVKSVVDDAVSFVLPMASDRHIPVEVAQIDPGLTMRSDPGKVRQMLINLLANALKFTMKGKVTVRAFARDDAVLLEVQDTGIGIEPEALEHIFEPFWQMQQTTTREVGGSGLGLPVAQRLATLLGGHIMVESKPSVGSTFRIVLPKEPSESIASRIL
jgi:Signal transduction histidine kinase